MNTRKSYTAPVFTRLGAAVEATRGRPRGDWDDGFDLIWHW